MLLQFDLYIEYINMSLKYKVGLLDPAATPGSYKISFSCQPVFIQSSGYNEAVSRQ